MQWVVSDILDRTSYDKAVLLDEAVFSITAANETRLVYWTKDAFALQDKFQNQAIHLLTMSYFTCCTLLIVGVLLIRFFIAHDSA